MFLSNEIGKYELLETLHIRLLSRTPQCNVYVIVEYQCDIVFLAKRMQILSSRGNVCGKRSFTKVSVSLRE